MRYMHHPNLATTASNLAAACKVPVARLRLWLCSALGTLTSPSANRLYSFTLADICEALTQTGKASCLPCLSELYRASKLLALDPDKVFWTEHLVTHTNHQAMHDLPGSIAQLVAGAG